MTASCPICASCEDTLNGLNSRIISIADSRLYNIRYELNREVEYDLFRLLSFYREVLDDICNDADCDCYTAVQCPTPPSDPVNTAISGAVVNHCVCGCCDPLNVVCNVVPCASPLCGPHSNARDVAHALTRENIIERIKILIA